MQKILTFIVAIAILYSIGEAKFSRAKETPPVAPTASAEKAPSQEEKMDGGFVERSLSQILANVIKTPEGRTLIENMIQPVANVAEMEKDGLIFDYKKLVPSMFRIKTSGTGTIGPASCGQKVKIQYTITKEDNTVVDSGMKAFILGSNDAIPALANVVVGMYVGQTRQAVAMPRYAYDDPQFQGENKIPGLNYGVRVTLLAIEDSIYITPNKVKIFDDMISYQIPLLCGQPVYFDTKISKIDGTVIYDSSKSNKKCEMIIGDRSMPMIFSYALFSKIPVGTRTVIFQSKYLKPFTGEWMKDVTSLVTEDEYLIMDISNSSVVQ